MILGISTLTQVSPRSQKVVSAPILLSPSTICVSPNSSKKIQTGGGKTVKLKVKTVITTNFNQVKQAEKKRQNSPNPLRRQSTTVPNKHE